MTFPALSPPSSSTAVGRWLVQTLAVLAILSLAIPADGQQDSVWGRIHSSGVGRYVPGRWATVKGVVANPRDEPQDILLVVTPPGGQQLQYARRMRLPPQTYYETQWPVRIPDQAKPGQEFRTLVFPGGEDDGVVRRRATDVGVASFNAVVRSDDQGVTAWFAAPDAPDQQDKGIRSLLQAVRYQGYYESSITSLQPRDYLHFPEALASVDQLCISTDELLDYPNLVEAIRLWIQRGGRLLLMVDRAGPRVAELLLGDALPMTVVGETSRNEVLLELNPDYGQQSYPVREVRRAFPEPVRWLRVIAEGGEPIWSVDGMPVALRLPFGRGRVLVTTIDAAVFTTEKFNPQSQPGAEPSTSVSVAPPYEMIPSSRRMLDTLLQRPDPILLDAGTVLQTSGRQIGYGIPGRGVAAVLAFVFPLALWGAGLWVRRSGAGQKLCWLIPMLSVVVAIPIAVAGMMNRAVAPPTVLETTAVQSVPGQTVLASDGFAVSYMPTSGEVVISGDDGSVVDASVDAGNSDLRRLQWTSDDRSEWINVNQSSGLKNFPVQSTMRSSHPLSAVATFDADGVLGTFRTGALQAPADLMFAGTSGTRMSVSMLDDQQFRIAAEDVLRRDLYLRDALMSETQQGRSEIYARLFEAAGRTRAFPERPSLLCWFGDSPSDVQIGPEEGRQTRSVLLVQPLDLMPPPRDTTVTIPSAFIERRSIADAIGSVSTVYNNSRRTWLEREGSASTLLEFLIPDVCRPFQIEEAELTLRIRAGSRTADIRTGTPDDLRDVTRLDSPVGTFEVALPVSEMGDTGTSGRFYLQVQVSDLDAGLRGDESDGEQDDSWLIESLDVDLRGRRTDPVN